MILNCIFIILPARRCQSNEGCRRWQAAGARTHLPLGVHGRQGRLLVPALSLIDMHSKDQMKCDILPAPDYTGKNESAEAFMRDAAFEYEDWWEQQHPEEAAKQAEEFFNEFYDCF